MNLKAIDFDETHMCVSFALPNVLNKPFPFGSMYINIDLWNEDAEEISEVREEFRKKWSDAALKDLAMESGYITSDELVELLCTRGMTADVEA